MGKAKKTRKFAEVKRLLNPKDLKPCVACPDLPVAFKSPSDSSLTHPLTIYMQYKCRDQEKGGWGETCVRASRPPCIFSFHSPQWWTSCRDKTPSALFFRYNTQLGPPYRVLIDTNFINFSIRNKIDLLKGMMDCLYAECTPCITDCVMAELEKLGQKYRVALKIAKDPRIERLPCTHKGTYADDCICERVSQHRCYIAATCDKDLRRRIRKIPGVPIMYIQSHKYTIERLPEATIGGAPRTWLHAMSYRHNLSKWSTNFM